MERAPLVSIIVPTYNRAEYLRQAVRSVLDQTYQPWELVVVDDGSTDDTRPFLEGLQDARLRVVWAAHCANPAALRNLGLAQARGGYVAFLDSDDLWRPTKLAAQVTDLESHPECGWSYTFCDWIGPRGEPLPVGPELRCRPYRGRIIEQVITVEAAIVTPSVMVRRDLLERIGGFDQTFPFFEDYECWARCALASPVTVVPRELVLVREHAASHTRGRAEVYEYWLRFVQQTAARTREPNFSVVSRRQSGRILLLLARHYRWRGAYGNAWRALGRALAHGPPPGAWLLAAIKTLLRPVLPAWARRLSGRRRVPSGRGAT
jgi:glycosyltransferase involved in cell wall biosynthesis